MKQFLTINKPYVMKRSKYQQYIFFIVCINYSNYPTNRRIQKCGTY